LLTFGLIIYVWEVSAEWSDTQALLSNRFLNYEKYYYICMGSFS